MQDKEPVAVAEEFCGFHQAVGSEADRIAAEFVDLEMLLAARRAHEIGPVAFAHDVDLVHAMAEIDPCRQRERRCQAASASPGRRMRIGDIKQQRRQCRFRLVVRARRQQLVAMIADERRGRFTRGKAGMAQAGNQKSLIGGDTERRGLLQSADQPSPRLVAVGAMADDLGDHRIVERRNFRTGLQRVLDANAVRHLPQRHPAGLRHEIMAGILGAQPHFDGVAGEFDILLPEPERFTGGDAQLQFDQIEPGDRLGDGMLDLQPRVHFHEIEFAVLVEQEFQRAGALIADRLDRGDRDRAHAYPQPRRHLWRRRFLDQLLMPPLHRAVALAEMDGVAVAVAEHLDFDVPGIDDGALQDHGGIAERALRLGARAAQRVRERRRIRHKPHAAPAAAGDRLDHDGEADLPGFRQHRGIALVRALIAGHDGHAGPLHDVLGAGLVTHRPDRFRRRADEDQPGIAAGLREILVLGEETIAGMHRRGAAGLCGGDDRLDPQV